MSIFEDVENPTTNDMKLLLKYIILANECSMGEAKQLLVGCIFDDDASEIQRQKIAEWRERIFGRKLK